jgi:hypothetical protein
MILASQMRDVAARCRSPLPHFFLGLTLLLGCGSNGSMGIERPPAQCPVQIQKVANEGAQHVPVGSQLTFASNPPASGPHYPYWGRWAVHSSPLPRGNYVHNLEHGGVALLYRCRDACPEIVAGLRAVMDAQPQDPSCTPPIRSRIVLTPDPDLDVPVAAAAWTYTYRADCVDAPSLSAFIRDHYDQAPESLCADGSVP